MNQHIIRCTRAQCARLFGFSMDTLRYYEQLGLVDVPRDASSSRRMYSEQQIMTLLDFRKAKSLGFDNEELLARFAHTGGITNMEMFAQSQKKLLAQISDLQEKVAYIRQLADIFCDLSGKLNTVRIGELPEREFLLFDQSNESLIQQAMQGLPYLNYGYYIPLRCLLGESPWQVNLAMDIRPLKTRHEALYLSLKENGSIHSNGSGTKVFLYQFYPQLSDLQPEDFDPLFAYADAHRYHICGDVFGGILGPDMVSSKDQRGYILTMTMEVE